MRTHNAALDAILGVRFPVLTDGWISVIDYMGDDKTPPRAARTSFLRQDVETDDEKDRGLTRYLMRHRHTTPFEMCELHMEVYLPLDVAAQVNRHRSASINQASARYTQLPDDFMLPAQICGPAVSNKQGRGAPLDFDGNSDALDYMHLHVHRSIHAVDQLIKGQAEYSGRPIGKVAPEIARKLGPVCQMTVERFKLDLHNLLHFLGLRMDKHAMAETRAYAEAMAQIVKAWLPVTWEAFEDYRLQAYTLSRMEASAVRRMLRGETVTFDTSGMTAREWVEFQDFLAAR
jgi:thymidylate synthase (FAD)